LHDAITTCCKMKFVRRADAWNHIVVSQSHNFLQQNQSTLKIGGKAQTADQQKKRRVGVVMDCFVLWIVKLPNINNRVFSTKNSC
jgi:hypothetical protein